MKPEDTITRQKQAALHKSVPFFNDIACYSTDEVLELFALNSRLKNETDETKLNELIQLITDRQQSIHPVKGAPDKVFLWNEGNMPSFHTYTENPDLKYSHDPDFLPYFYAFLLPSEQTPKGAVVVCAGAAHGDANIHEGYQSCIDLNKLGYQCFLLLNRPNLCPYDSREAGADASRAIRLIRKNAAKYRIDPNHVAFAGFSNGGLTAEACIQYFSGTQQVTSHFPDYVPDAADLFYGAPDAVLNIYGPRRKESTFDYTNVVYPPVFFAVGRDDAAYHNLEAVLPELREHHIETEVHTFAGVPHGQSGVTIYGNHSYPHFQLWLQLADAFLQNVFAKSVIKHAPDVLEDRAYRFDAFSNGTPLLHKKKHHLPAMGWNSWNAFGSGNTEQLTKETADAIVALGLQELGYQYIVLDDGCYKPVREGGRLSNEPLKFPSGFRALSDYIHEKGLKFGMYNDIGTNLCAGAAVGTCGHEETDADSYVSWGVDFLKVDNCYYLFDNATFSDSANAKYVYAPNIRAIRLSGPGLERVYTAAEGTLRGDGAFFQKDYVTNIGTFDGTGPDQSPVGDMSSELCYTVCVSDAGTYQLSVEYATDTVAGTGSWLQIAVGDGEQSELVYDDFLPSTATAEDFRFSMPIALTLAPGENRIRLMNHRRQENTLSSYAALLEGLKKADPQGDIIFSICEWGKTQPQNWGYKVGDSWRILNDITFRVGADGDPGHGSWAEDYTTSVTSQYNKAVIMDEFAGLDKGWNDPDMMMIGMDGLTETMCRTHMTMWCMMNAPLMLGLDLRRVKKGDNLWNLIANRDMISLNQDSLGVQAKRIYSSLAKEMPDKEYIRDNHRTDILAKPLADGSIAVSFINISEETSASPLTISLEDILTRLEKKTVNAEALKTADAVLVKNLWTGEEAIQTEKCFTSHELAPCDNMTIKITPFQRT